MTVRRREYDAPTGRPAWSYDFCHRGVRHRKAGFETKAEAQLAEADARRRAREAAPRRRTGPTLFSAVVKQHVSLLTIAKWVGHSSLTMINNVYAHLDDDFHQEEMRRTSFTS